MSNGRCLVTLYIFRWYVRLVYSHTKLTANKQIWVCIVLSIVAFIRCSGCSRIYYMGHMSYIRLQSVLSILWKRKIELRITVKHSNKLKRLMLNIHVAISPLNGYLIELDLLAERHDCKCSHRKNDVRTYYSIVYTSQRTYEM